MELTRDAAWALLTEFTRNENLEKHALAVEAAVRGYARQVGRRRNPLGRRPRPARLRLRSLPDLADHPFRGPTSCRERGCPERLVRAAPSHADHTGVPRESRLEHTLFACDEMAGFVTAARAHRPSKSLLDLEAKSVVKRMKEKAFARAVNRDDLRRAPAGRARGDVIAFHARAG